VKTTTDERREDDDDDDEDEKRENDWIRGVVASSSSLGRKATATLTAVCVSLAPLGAEAVEFASVQNALDDENRTSAAALANEKQERIKTMMGEEQRYYYDVSRNVDEEDDLNAQLAEAIRRGDASKVADIGVKLKEKEDEEKRKLIEPNYVTKVQKSAPLKDEEKPVVDLFTKSKSAVVFITNVAVRRDVFTLSLTEQPQGAGSGIIWDDEGHVVTNYHVIKDANELKVQFSLQNNRGLNGKGKINDVLDACDAVVVGFDDDKDIAVLKLMDENCYKNKAKALPIGSSSSLQVGQKVFAIGNPFGLDHTLTTGVVSGLSRQIQSGNTGRPIDGIIQTDAAINPGNSGGPLLNSSGQLIGLNTAIYSASGTSSGVGFALPVDMVTGIVDQIIRFGRVTRPIIGVSFAPDEIAEQLGLGGVLVLDAREGGPAERAGIRSTKRDDSGRLLLGDVIVGIEDEKIEDSYDLFRALDKHVVGDSVKISVFRDTDRKVLDFIVKLDDIKDMKPPSTTKNLNRRNAENNNTTNNNNGDDGFFVPPGWYVPR
jgi:S1-C subfamily serine protease